MVMNKKADMTVSFSWIFMIIVGAFFLLLTWKIIANYQVNKDIEYRLELKQALRSVFNNFGRTAGIEENKLAPLGNIFRDSDVEIVCNDDIPILSINENLDANNEYLRSYPTFMTFISQGKQDNTYMAVESFRMPFKITNMLAIVSKKNLIVIDKNSDFGKKLYKKFKRGSYSDLNYIYIDFDFDIDSFNSRYMSGKNLNSVVFVTDYNNPNFNDLDISSLNVLTSIVGIEQIKEEYGTIYFRDQADVVSSYIYYDYDSDLALPTMAVFSSPKTFNCSYSILLDSAQSVYNFYEEKSNYYKDLTQTVCVSGFDLNAQRYHYEDVGKQIIDIRNELKTTSFIKIDDLDKYIKELDDKNSKLEASSCPYIY